MRVNIHIVVKDDNCKTSSKKNFVPIFMKIAVT